MNKHDLIEKILLKLEKRYQIAVDATQAAMADATDEETKPEHKYDTLALEAAYLAHGQAVRVQECEADLQQYKKLPLKQYSQDESVALGALVGLLDEEDKQRWFFLGPCAGGVQVSHEDKEVTLITVKAPLGRAILNKQLGDDIELNIAGKTVCYEVAEII